jgi:hypothetical protein
MRAAPRLAEPPIPTTSGSSEPNGTVFTRLPLCRITSGCGQTRAQASQPVQSEETAS